MKIKLVPLFIIILFIVFFTIFFKGLKTSNIYVPDFLVVYSDKKGNRHAEVIEVKPKKETNIKSAGRNPLTQAKVVNNLAKWEAARAWCKQNNLVFRIITEEDIFHRPQKR